VPIMSSMYWKNSRSVSRTFLESTGVSGDWALVLRPRPRSRDRRFGGTLDSIVRLSWVKEPASAAEEAPLPSVTILVFSTTALDEFKPFFTSL